MSKPTVNHLYYDVWSDYENTISIQEGETIQMFPINSLIIISDETDLITLRTIGSRKNVVSFLWNWFRDEDFATKDAVLEEINSIIYK